MDRVNFFRLLNARVRSSTMIEVITALIIISMVFTMATVIYLNVQRSGSYSRRLNANIVLDEMYNATIRDKKFDDGELTVDNITVYRDVKTQTSQNGRLIIIKLAALEEGGKVLAEQKHLFYVTDQP